MYVKKIIFEILLLAVVKMKKNIEQVLWMIQWSCVMKLKSHTTKNIPTNFNEKKTTSKTQNFNILLAFLLINIALLIAVSI